MATQILDNLSGTGMVGGGNKYAVVTATTTLIKNGPGRCVRISITAGTGAVTINDGNAGTTVFTIAATAVGNVFWLDWPCTVGISVIAGVGTTAVVSYT